MCIVCECDRLKDYSALRGKKELDCSGCRSLTTLNSVPYIAGLQTLYCGGCTSLTSIPVLAGLHDLYCEGCPLLYIPVMLRRLLNYNEKSRHCGKRLRRIAHNVRYNVVTKKGLKIFVNERIISSMDRSSKVFDNLTFHILCRYVFEM